MNILVFCTYPINEPKHGGQLRVRNIVDAYRTAGHQVEVVGVLGSDQYEHEAGFVKFPGMSQLRSVVRDPFLVEDYAIGCLFSQNTEYRDLLFSCIRRVPDLVHVEQPWLFKVAQQFVEREKKDIKIIYGSQNVEWILKSEIMATYIKEAKEAQLKAELIKKIELSAIQEADAVICVSQKDAKWIELHTKNPIVVAPNGVSPWRVSSVGVRDAAAIITGYRYALYCASAHPPNMTGFFNMFGGGFGSLKPDEKMVIAGGAGKAIVDDIRLHQSAKLAEKVVVAGMVSKACLNGLLEGAQCIVLPLTQGGGTNLKTAEALWSGKHIVATSVAMRGFEEFIGSKGVRIADNACDFKRALRWAMEEPELSLTSEERVARQSVLWAACMNPLINFINSIPETRNL